MDGFSVASLTSLTLALQHRAFAAADEVSQHVGPESGHRERFGPLAASIEQLGQNVTDVHLTLESRPAISMRLQTFLSQYLSSCDPAMAALTKQLMRIQPEAMHDVNWGYMTAQVTLLKKYSEMFAYLEEMLRVYVACIFSF